MLINSSSVTVWILPPGLPASPPAAIGRSAMYVVLEPVVARPTADELLIEGIDMSWRPEARQSMTMYSSSLGLNPQRRVNAL